MKKVRRDGKWVTIDKDGKVIDAAYRKKKGQEFRKKIDDYRSEQLDKLRIGVREFGKNLIYSDELDDKGNLQTVAQAENKAKQLAIKDDSFSAFRSSQRRDPKEFKKAVYKDPANEAANVVVVSPCTRTRSGLKSFKIGWRPCKTPDVTWASS